MRGRALLILGALLVAALGWSYAVATATPVVRRAAIPLRDWAPGAPALRVVLISDVHVAGPDMPPARLSRIVEQINALRPDLVLIAGDFISDKRVATRHYSMAEAIRPLEKLKTRLGTAAVLGNHDYRSDAPGAIAALRAAGVTLLSNDARRFGPLVAGGLDDDFTDHSDLPRAIERLMRLPGPKLLLSHSPDPFPDVPEDIPLTLAGHTHCGQIRVPLIGAVVTASRHGRRYACGLIREDGKTLIVTAGLGTSGLPFRLGAVPDLWLLTIGPVRPDAAR